MLRSIGSVAFLALSVVGCGGGSNAPPPAYSVSGVVSGLAGTGLVLRDNGGDDLPVSANGVATFATKIASGSPYAVTVFTQPRNPAQTCTVKYGNGTMGGSQAIFEVACNLDPFNGFVAGQFRYTDISAADARTGPVLYDGAGTYSGSYESDAAGVITAGTIAGVYTAAVDGAITVGGYSGGVTVDGNTIVSADLQAGHAPSIDVEIKQGQGNFTNANFSGAYEVVSVDSLGDTATSLALAADGAGHYSGKLALNKSGVVTNSAVAGTYSVAADGALTLTPASGSPLSGGISADGKTLVLSQLTAGQPSALAVGIKQGQASFGSAEIVGNYTAVTYGLDSAELANLQFDGAGKLSGTLTRNIGTVPTFSLSVAGTYSVTVDGALTIELTQKCNQMSGCHGLYQEALTGGVSSDGNTLALMLVSAGPNGAAPGACVAVRLSNQ